MNTKVLKVATLFLVLSVVFASCEKDEGTPEIKGGEIAMASAIPNPDGMSGSIYLQLIDDTSTKTYDNESALQFALHNDQIVMKGEDIYILPFAQSDIIERYSRGIDKKLSKTGQLDLDANSMPTSIVLKNDTKAYIALMGRAKILIINPTTLVKTGEIDITDYAIGDANPDANQMVFRDGKLYVALAQMVGGYYAADNRPKTDILIINTETDEVEKMITEETTGMSQPTRPVECNQMFIDENNDIYIMCQGGFGAVPGHKCGLLRIKSGETEFDDTYSLCITDAIIAGESNKSNSVLWMQYAGNGKIYAHAVVPAYWGNPVSYLEDRVCVPVEIDAYNKTIKKLDLPRSNSLGCVGIYDNKIMFGLSTDTEDGFFTYDLNTGEVSSEAVIKTTGVPSLFKHFGETY